MITIDPQIISADSEQKEPNRGSVLINMESLIKASIDSLENTKEEKKKVRGMLDDIYNNNPTYRDHKEKSKDAAKVLKATKAQIDKQPQVAELKEKLKTLGSESKDTQLSLFDYLGEYQRLSGVNEIESNSGEIFTIKNEARLVKKSPMFR